MNRLYFVALLMALGAFSANLMAQSALELPRKSPLASVAFQIGFTEVGIRYSSPAARGRSLWGNLVPYDQVWRAGANEATLISFSEPVQVEGRPLAAGRYAFFVIPRATGLWTAIFNADTSQWGAYAYDESADVMRIDLAVDTLCSPEERLHYYLSDTGLGEGQLCLRWDRRQICLNITTPFIERVQEQLLAVTTPLPPAERWRPYAEAADYLSSSDAHLSWALYYATESTARFDHSWNWWIRAQIEARMGDFAAAVISANRAVAAGLKDATDNFFQSNQQTIRGKINDWSGRTGR
jgi:hypothetical protein